MAPYDASTTDATTMLLSNSGVYVAANGAKSNVYTLRSRLNHMAQYYSKDSDSAHPS